MILVNVWSQLFGATVFAASPFCVFRTIDLVVFSTGFGVYRQPYLQKS